MSLVVQVNRKDLRSKMIKNLGVVLLLVLTSLPNQISFAQDVNKKVIVILAFTVCGKSAFQIRSALNVCI